MCSSIQFDRKFIFNNIVSLQERVYRRFTGISHALSGIIQKRQSIVTKFLEMLKEMFYRIAFFMRMGSVRSTRMNSSLYLSSRKGITLCDSLSNCDTFGKRYSEE